MNYHLRPRRMTQGLVPLALKYALRLTAGLACLLWLGVPALRAADRYVVPPGTPGGTNAGNYTSWSIAATQIQFAVAKAGAGETVWVTNGTYYLTNTLSVGNITLRSVNGRERTTLNGNYPAYSNGCLYLNGGQAVVTGLTIMNGFNTNSGWAAYYGGVKMSAGTMRNCHVATNTALHGGGVLVDGAAQIYDCIISSNSLIAGGGGAGMYILSSGALISNCVFRGNVCAYRGGGLNNLGSGNIIINCSFINNSAGYGSGIYNGGASIYRNCLLVGNYGAGAINFENAGLIQNSTIVGNIGVGANLYLGGGSMEHCLVYGNNPNFNLHSMTTNFLCASAPVMDGRANFSALAFMARAENQVGGAKLDSLAYAERLHRDWQADLNKRFEQARQDVGRLAEDLGLIRQAQAYAGDAGPLLKLAGALEAAGAKPLASADEILDALRPFYAMDFADQVKTLKYKILLDRLLDE